MTEKTKEVYDSKYTPFYAYRCRGFDYAVSPYKNKENCKYVAVLPSTNTICAWFTKDGKRSFLLDRRFGRKIYRRLSDKILKFLNSI